MTLSATDPTHRLVTEAKLAESVGDLVTEAAAIVPRMEQIETMAGLAPGEVTDAQTANLISRANTSTRAALGAAIVSGAVEAVGGRMVFTDDLGITVPDGTVVFHYQGPRAWVESLSDGLIGFTPRWARRTEWVGGKGSIALPYIAPGGTARLALSIDALGSNERDVEIRAVVERSQKLGALHCGVIFRGSGVPGQEGGVAVGFINETLTAGRYQNGTYSTISTVPAGIQNATRYVIRARMDGNKLQAKVWQEGTAEPAAWMLDSVVDTNSGPGWAGLVTATRSMSQTWSNLSVATQGNTAVQA